MRTVVFIFRNGTTFTANCESITVTSGSMTNDLRGLKWVGMQPDPLYIDLQEILAVFVYPPPKEGEAPSQESRSDESA